jgi:hypothetical protein
MRHLRHLRQVRHPMVSSAVYDDEEFRARSVPVTWIVLASLIRSKSTMIPVVTSWGAMRFRLDDGPVRFPGQAFGATTLSLRCADRIFVSSRKLIRGLPAEFLACDPDRSPRKCGLPRSNTNPPTVPRRFGATRSPARRRARQPVPRIEHRHLDLDLLAVDHAQVFFELDRLAADFAMQRLCH